MIIVSELDIGLIAPPFLVDDRLGNRLGQRHIALVELVADVAFQ